MTSSASLPGILDATLYTSFTKVMTAFYSISTELCLACSGSALSGSQRPRPISKPRFKSSLKEQPSTNAAESNSSSPDDSDRKDELELEYEHELDMSIFRTQCCNRPICSACLASNPRLARYVPCLACLGGVHAVAGPSGPSSSSLKHSISSSQKLKQDKDLELDMNLNGALRDRDVFVLGDDEEDYSDAESNMPSRRTNKTPPPAYSATISNTPSPSRGENEEPGQPPGADVDSELQSTGGTKVTINGRQREVNSAVERPSPTPTTTPITASTEIATKPTPRIHYIQKGDTLRGLALRYGVDGRVLCRLNNLPPSTLTTTPHILHTRTTLILPPSAKSLPPSEEESHDCDPERERQTKLEKTAKRLQLITKEADWDVAKAYAVLAQPSSSSSSSSSASLSSDMRTRLNGFHTSTDRDQYHLRQPLSKERHGVDEKSTCTDEKANLSQRRGTMQERALDTYLEDNTWEARERAEGRGPPSTSTSTASPTSHRLLVSPSTPTSRHPKNPTERTAKTKKWFF
ncbi:hypothetical protein ACEPAF_8625 [Sanghuangporus sanghuang]